MSHQANPVHQLTEPIKSVISRASWADREMLQLKNRNPSYFHRFDSFDPWFHFMPILKEHGIVVSTAVGNDGRRDKPPVWIDIDSPQRYALRGVPGRHGGDGGASDTMIVVGAVDKFAKGIADWQNHYTDIITVYAPGEGIACAYGNENMRTENNEGTSYGTGLVSGLVATFLGRDDFLSTLPAGHPPGAVAVAMKTWVKQVAEYHGSSAVPLIGTHNYVLCPDDETTKPGRESPTDDPDDPGWENDPDRDEPLPDETLGLKTPVRIGGVLQAIPNSVSASLPSGVKMNHREGS